MQHPAHARSEKPIHDDKEQVEPQGLGQARQPKLRANLWRQPRTFKSQSPARHQFGGAGRDRTDDLMLAKHALSQLSYGPVLGRVVVGGAAADQMVGPVRFELTTPRLSSVCSDQLSYEPPWLNSTKVLFSFEEGMRRRRRGRDGKGNPGTLV